MTTNQKAGPKPDVRPKRQKTVKAKDPEHSCTRSDFVLQFDTYGQPLSFNYPGGDSDYKSCCGSVISLIILLVSLLYGGDLLYVCYMFEGNSYTSFDESNFFSSTDAFTGDKFQVAVGFSYPGEADFSFTDLIRIDAL